MPSPIPIDTPTPVKKPKSQALLLIDIQNDYFPGGAMELVGAEGALQQAATLLKFFRLRGAPIIHVQHISKNPAASFFRPGTRGADIHERLRPIDGEAVIVKHFPNSFRCTGLLDLLREQRVEELVIAGMMTHMCVDTTVRAAADFGFDCLLAADACATRDLQFGSDVVKARDVQIAYLAGLHGSFATVLRTNDLLRSVDSAPQRIAAPRGWRRRVA